jgi:hypothetical protein
MGRTTGLTFAPGQTIARRYFKRHINTWVQAARVVADDEHGLLLWQAEGSDYLMYRDAAGRSIQDVPVDEIDARLIPTTWRSTSVLMLQPPDVAYSVWWFFRNGRFDGWYVNLETPYVRWQDGIDTVDHALDLVVHPDLTLEWKDEDEFTARTDHPWYWSAGEAAEIRATAQRLAKTAATGTYPFDGTFCDFTPDPAWAPARLPAGWDRPRGG